jgi:DNA ligase 1
MATPRLVLWELQCGVQARLLDFARANDAAAGTPGKLRKQAILAEYLRGLSDEQDLRLAVRFASGRAFAASSEAVLNVGGATVYDAALRRVGAEAGVFYQQVVTSGEIGEAAAALWPAEVARDAGPLTLGELEAGFERLSRMGVVQSKREVVGELFARCGDAREGAYLVKIMLGDLRTGVRDGLLEAAIAEAFGKMLAEVRRCRILVGDLEEVAVLARRDELHTARFRLFHPIPFMLAAPQETAADAAAALSGRAFIVEDKLDGIRAQVHKSGDRVVIYTRTMDRAEEAFADVVAAMAKLPGEFVLDGELVPWCDGCVLPFVHIQRRLGRKSLSRRTLRDNPVAFMPFDVLYMDGELLIDVSLRERREHLERLKTWPAELATPVAVEARTEQAIERAFAAARERRNEGVVLKDLESPYAPGRRGKAWLKLKTHLPTLDCVVTAAEYGHGKRRGVLSDYTFAVWDGDPQDPSTRLVNVGKAYSGVTDAEIAQLTALFLDLSRQRQGARHLVEPRVVLEVAFDQVQRSARHASGYALRFPRIKHIRWDKTAAEADRLDRVAEIYQSGMNFARGRAVERTAEPTLFD